MGCVILAPVSEDGLNHKWDGANDAPSTNDAKALHVAGVEDAASRDNGVDSQSSRTTCNAANAATRCKSDFGETFSWRTGKTDGYCIPTLFGVCHSWSPAATLITEPRHAVRGHGVRFKINDLKALASLVPGGVETRFVSLR